MLSLLTPPRIELITRLKKVAAVDTYSRREFCWLYSLLGSSLNQRRETGLSAAREARSRGSRSDITTLHVTPCSNLTNTNPVCATHHDRRQPDRIPHPDCITFRDTHFWPDGHGAHTSIAFLRHILGFLDLMQIYFRRLGEAVLVLDVVRKHDAITASLPFNPEQSAIQVSHDVQDLHAFVR